MRSVIVRYSVKPGQEGVNDKLVRAAHHAARWQHWVTPCGHADLNRRKAGASRE